MNEVLTGCAVFILVLAFVVYVTDPHARERGRIQVASGEWVCEQALDQWVCAEVEGE